MLSLLLMQLLVLPFDFLVGRRAQCV